MSPAEEKEHSKLEAKVREYGLGGKEALAFMLSAKLGSLDDAFKYLDSASRDCFAPVSWHTGLLVLRIEAWLSTLL